MRLLYGENKLTNTFDVTIKFEEGDMVENPKEFGKLMDELDSNTEIQRKLYETFLVTTILDLQ